MYLVAFLLPPLAILMTGRLFQAIFSVFLLPFYFPSALWAILVVADHKANKRADRTADRIARKQRGGNVAVTTNVQVNNIVQVVNPVHEPSALVAEVVADRQREAARAGQKAVQAEQERKRERTRRIFALVSEGRTRAAQAIRALPSASASAYHELPEWAQPITWGLAAGTPFSIVAVFLFLRSN